MPRIARVIAPGMPHHITHRGNYRQNVFEEEIDFVKYLQLINNYAKQYSLLILNYCLMPNHIHFIVVPKDEESLSKIFNVVQMIYAQYFNSKRKVTGHLWQGRFYSCVLSEKHLYATIRYVERNPVRAKLAKKPWDWKWSSAQEHVYRKQGPIKLAGISEFIEIKSWKEFLEEEVDDSFLREIREKTKTGRPLGNITFVDKLEGILKRELHILPKGRPKKNKK